ncbi:hypothetical protein AB7W58_23425 [Providencia rettgeri]
MKLKVLISVSLLLASGSAVAEHYCSTEPSDIKVSLENISVPPGAEIGAVVATSPMTEKVTECKNAPYLLVAYADISANEPTGVYVDWPSEPAGAGYTEKCEAMKSGFPGLGIAWVNFNSAANRWQCASITESGIVTRGLVNGRTTIYDQIILVKTGVIGSGSGQNEEFNFNKVFQFNERKDTHGGTYLPDNGLLYKLTLEGNTVIQAPVCNASSASNSYNFTTEDAVNKNYTTSPVQVIDVTCTGVIENGSIATFKPISNNGIFSLDGDYFATNNPDLGVIVKYTTNTDTELRTLLPDDDINVIINDNKAKINLSYIPYVKNGSGDYPLDDNIQFNLTLSNGGG